MSKPLIVAFAMLLGTSSLWAGELQEFKWVKYVPDKSNDGDSFLVMMGEKEQRVRLYFVDCPEMTAGSETDARRVREQMRYFGLVSGKETRKFGVEATEFTRKALAKPFIMHTSFASALGRSAGGRIYAFITTSTGEDLARLLVMNGYARTLGVYRKTPGGVHHDEMKKQLEDLELGAAMKPVGIWTKTDTDRLAELRKKQRQEDEELKKIQGAEADGKININEANKRKLQEVKGIGEKKAQGIIDGRPYDSVDELVKVKGISETMLEEMRSRFYVPQD